MQKNVLVIGSGAREDAIAYKCKQSSHCGSVYVLPGNGGTSRFGTQVKIPAIDFEKIATFCWNRAIHLAVVGPDNLIALGLVDFLRERGVKCIGATQYASKIEWSKAHAKRFMKKCGIQTPPFKVFKTYGQALTHVRRKYQSSVVIKASGLALGKGTYLCHTPDEAEDALHDIMIRRVHGDAGNEVVVEEFLKATGVKEFSIHALCDGENYVLFPPCQDHKTLTDSHGVSRMTGGMGIAYPAFLPDHLMREVNEMIARTLAELRGQDRPYTGFLYLGCMETELGLHLLEYNARPGDPEGQVYMMALMSDALELFDECDHQRLGSYQPQWHEGGIANVVLASRGYPGEPEVGQIIEGIHEAERVPGVTIFHAGTKLDEKKYVTSGGRVLNVCAKDVSLDAAIHRAYTAVGHIHFDGMQYRRDIGKELLVWNELNNYV